MVDLAVFLLAGLTLFAAAFDLLPSGTAPGSGADDTPDTDPDAEMEPTLGPIFEAPSVPGMDPEDPTVDGPILEGPANPFPEEGASNDVQFQAGERTVGTDGDDVFTPILNGETFENTTLEGGDGDDTFNLLDPNPPANLFNSDYFFSDGSISGGAGNDTILVAAFGSSISGGAGNDVITMPNAGGSIIDGGNGDDQITAQSRGQDPVSILGGDGDDLIDARGVENGAINGGNGSDTILIDQPNQGGAGYVLSTNGGAGNDTLVFETTEITTNTFDPSSMEGGAGSDTFALRINEGAPEGGNLDLTEAETDDPDLVRLGLVDLPDFTPGEDVITVQAEVANSAYILAQAMLIEDTAAGTTQLVISYENPDALDRDFVVTIGATGVDWEDVTFIGDTIPTLAPIGATSST